MMNGICLSGLLIATNLWTSGALGNLCIPAKRTATVTVDCQAPRDHDVLRAMPHAQRGIPYIYEVWRDDIEINKEKLVDRVDPVRFYPFVGPARLHHCHWKCTVHFTETTSLHYPFPVETKRRRTEVVYIDTNYLNPCGSSDTSRISASSESATPRGVQRPVGPPDVLLIHSLHLAPKKEHTGVPQVRGEHLIRPDGTMSLGVFGMIHVGGMTLPQVKATVERHLAPYFVNPVVAVDLKERRNPTYHAGSTEESSVVEPHVPMAFPSATGGQRPVAQQVHMDIMLAQVDESAMKLLPFARRSQDRILEEFMQPQQILGVLQELRRQGKAEILSEPRVATLSGRPAYVQLGTDMPVLTPGGGGPAVAYKRVGTTVHVLPIVQNDGKILLEVRPEIVVPDDSVTIAVPGGKAIAGFRTSSAQVTAAMKSGQTLAASTAAPDKSKQLLVLVTAHLVPPVDRGKSHYVTLNDIVRLSKRGISEDIILRQVADTGSMFDLTVGDILSLNEQGVSDSVIRALQSRRVTTGTK